MHVKAGKAVTTMAATIGLLAVSQALSLSADAQVTPVPAPGSKQAIPEKQGAPMSSGRSDSLSGKLSNSGGVITPNGDIDPGMKVPAPDPQPHSTPVIPPSATGGNSAK